MLLRGVVLCLAGVLLGLYSGRFLAPESPQPSLSDAEAVVGEDDPKLVVPEMGSRCVRFAVSSPDFCQRTELYNRVALMSDLDRLGTIITDGISEDSRPQDVELALIAMARYADIDAASAISFFRKFFSNSSARHRFNFGELLVAEVGRQDPKLALKLIDLISAGDERIMALSKLLSSRFLSEAQTNSLYAELSDFERQKLSLLALQKLDPAEAFAESLNLASPSDREASLIDSVSRWAATDPIAAFDRLRTIEGAVLKRRLLKSLFAEWAIYDFSLALNYAETLRGGSEIAVATVLAVHAVDQPDAALELALDRSGSDLTNPIVRSVLGAIGRENPQSALELTSDLLENGEDLVSVVDAIAEQYMKIDPDRALDWLGTMDDDVLLPTVSKYGRQYVEQFPTAARERIENIPDGPRKTSLVAMYVDATFDSEPRTTMEWLDQYQEEEFYNPVVRRGIARWSETDPESALSFVVDGSNNQELVDQTIPTVVTRLVVRNKNRAVELISSLPRHSRDIASRTAGKQIATSDWATGMELIDDIQDLKLRKDTRIEAIYRLSRRDPIQAASEIRRYELGDLPQAKQLLERIEVALENRNAQR